MLQPKSNTPAMPPRFEKYRDLIFRILDDDNLPVIIECESSRDAQLFRQAVNLLLRRFLLSVGEDPRRRPVIARKENKLIVSAPATVRKKTKKYSFTLVTASGKKPVVL